MKYDMQKFFKLVDEKKIEITTGEIQFICFDDDDLPDNNSDIYFFISLMVYKGCLKRRKKGIYDLDWSVINGL